MSNNVERTKNELFELMNMRFSVKQWKAVCLFYGLSEEDRVFSQREIAILLKCHRNEIRRSLERFHKYIAVHEMWFFDLIRSFSSNDRIIELFPVQVLMDKVGMSRTSAIGCVRMITDNIESASVVWYGENEMVMNSRIPKKYTRMSSDFALVL